MLSRRFERMTGKPSLFDPPLRHLSAQMTLPESSGIVQAEELTVKEIIHPGLLDCIISAPAASLRQWPVSV